MAIEAGGRCVVAPAQVAIAREFIARENAQSGEQMSELILPYRMTGMSRYPHRVWRSSTFLAQLFVERGGHRLTVNRTAIDDDGQWVAGITWDELMRVKRECGFGDRWAIEIYPPDTSVVDVANLRHLWLLPGRPACGWSG